MTVLLAEPFDAYEAPATHQLCVNLHTKSKCRTDDFNSVSRKSSPLCSAFFLSSAYIPDHRPLGATHRSIVEDIFNVLISAVGRREDAISFWTRLPCRQDLALNSRNAVSSLFCSSAMNCTAVFTETQITFPLSVALTSCLASGSDSDRMVSKLTAPLRSWS